MSDEFRVLGVDHVTITTPDELRDEVVTWYRECLGLQPVDPPDGYDGAWFRAGNQEIHITVDPHNPPKTAHFCLIVDDFDRAIDALRGAKCHIEQAREVPGRKRLFTRDPAGNSLELAVITEVNA